MSALKGAHFHMNILANCYGVCILNDEQIGSFETQKKKYMHTHIL